MLGVLRFILAYCVFLSHFPEAGLKLNLGITAVIVFYFISGFLMMKSYTRFKSHSSQPVRAFYLDRCIKIFPQYWIVLLASLVAYGMLGESVHNTYEFVSFESSKVLFDFLLLPVNYAVGSAIDLFPSIAARPIVPPAWSLAVELHFYLLVPLLFILKGRTIGVVALLSAALLTMSLMAEPGRWDMANFGYFHIPTMLVVFLLGLLSASEQAELKHGALILWAYFAILFVVILPAFSAWYNFAVQEVGLGIMLSLPLFFYATHFKHIPVRVRAVDQWLGDLAYPVFLTHYLAMFLAQHLFGVGLHAKIYFMFTTVIIMLVLSIALASLQRYIDRLRINHRGFKSLRAI